MGTLCPSGGKGHGAVQSSIGLSGPVRRHRRDIVGVAWVIVAGVAALVPALIHGQALGPYDILTRLGLTQHAGLVVHNPVTSDQIDEMIPWTNLAWTQVHQGHLPLWNPYSALGMPLAFNWQSAAFGLPALVGYLFPLSLAYTVGVVVTLVVAGTGVYVLGRTLHLSVVGCALAGTVYELAGPFFGWLGWPIASVMSWAGWIFGAVVLVARGERRFRSVLFLALVVAAAVYAGQPDSLIELAFMTAVFVVVLLGLRTRVLGGSGPIVRPALDLVVAGIAGVALGAPLLLPGFQVLSRSVRDVGGRTLGSQEALSLRDFANVFVGNDGATDMVYATLGAIVVVLAITGAAVQWRRRAVKALVVTAFVTALLSFAEPFIIFMNALPELHAVRWPRAITGLAFVVAVLAGVGMDALVRGRSARTVRRFLVAGFAVTAVAFVAVVTLVTVPPVPADFAGTFPDGFRGRSVLWGTVALAAGVVAAAILVVAHRRPGAEGARGTSPFTVEYRVGVLLLVVSSAVLVATAAPLWTSTSGFTSTSAEAELARTVGSGTVGLGPAAQMCAGQPGLGLLPNVNLVIGVHEMAAYDPMISRTYFSSWLLATGASGGYPRLSTYCPVVTSATTAREFGIGYVLEAPADHGPTGAVFDRKIGGEDLYRIPGAAAATLTPLPTTGALPSDEAPGTPVPVAHPSPAVWRLSTSADTEQILRLHLTDSPGWHATIDGHPLPLETFAGLMIEARIPPGRHVVTVTYWPSTFTFGLVVAAIAVIGLGAATVVAGSRRRRSQVPSQPR